MSRHDRVHLVRLVALLDQSPHSLSPLELIKLQTTARHARHLLDEQLQAGGGEASTSRGRPAKDSLVDLDERLSRAEMKLAKLADEVQPTTKQSDLFFLPLPPLVPPPLPSLPPDTAPSPSRSATPDPASTLREVSEFSSAPNRIKRSSTPRTREPSATSASDSLPANRSSTPVSPVDSNDDNAYPPSATLRQRPNAIPPYLAARRAREQQEKERQAAAASGDKGKERELASSAAADLLPADSSTSSSDLLSHHHALQSTLLDSLTGLSGALKTSTIAFSENLAKDKEVMEKAQGKLEKNSESMEKQQQRLKEQEGRSRGTTCWTVGAVVVVIVAWVMMFGLMRVVPK
ncbi:hypothetical protein JCM8547_006252 [Rhodosporidiobolus lusitaniae]